MFVVREAELFKMAYIAGLVASDGNITCIKRTCKIKIVTRSYDFAAYIRSVMSNFCKASIHENRKCNTYEVYCYSKELATYLVNEFDLKIGAKARDIVFPSKHESEVVISYLRGLYDGDSSITEVPVRLRRSSKIYVYALPRIMYKSKSFKLIRSMLKYLRQIGLRPYSWRDNDLYVLSLDGIKNIKKFAEIIGYTHPDKHKKLSSILLKYSNSHLLYYGEPAGEGVRNSSPAEAAGPENRSGLKPAAETPGRGRYAAVIR